MDFPHLSDNDFPNVENVNVWNYKNTFDYSRWNAGTKLKLCSVPWCGDYGNAVKFADDAARDAWFDAQAGETVTLESDFRVLPDGTVKLPVPFDILAGYNYLVAEYKPAPGQSPYIDYETAGGKKRFFWFVTDMIYKAPNTTELLLDLDYWTTYINDVEISYMQLERGHAPLAAMSATEYLENPQQNCAGLLTPDISADEARTMRGRVDAIINTGGMMVCFTSTANLEGDWGSKTANTWEVAEFDSAVANGAPVNVKLYAVDAGSYSAFCSYIELNIPQFVQTVQGVFLMPQKLLTLGTAFNVGSIICYECEGRNGSLGALELTKELFGYPAEYTELAKLYTSPYAHLELIDYATGASQEIRVEDTGGSIGIDAIPSLLWPFLSIDVLLSGVGGDSGSVTFERVGAQGIFDFSGAWYKHMTSCRVPIFAMTQGNSRNYDFSTHFLRRQQSAELDALLQTSYDNADMILTNTNVAIATSVDNMNVGQDAETYIRGRNADKLNADVAADIEYAESYLKITSAQELSQSNINKSQTVANALTGIVIGIGTVAAAVATGGSSIVAEAAIIGGASTAVASITNASISVASTDASVSLTLSTNAEVFNANKTQIVKKTEYAIALARETQTLQQNAVRSQLINSNAASRTQASNNRALARANAERGNAIGHTGITRQVSQAELMAPVRYGSTTDNGAAGTRPQGVSLAVVTQSAGAIKLAGDTFLRYGYFYGGPWQVSNLNLMEKFTYWKASDLWVSGAQSVLEYPQQRIKEIFQSGVTVWSNPDFIGKTSIYENEVM